MTPMCFWCSTLTSASVDEAEQVTRGAAGTPQGGFPSAHHHRHDLPLEKAGASSLCPLSGFLSTPRHPSHLIVRWMLILKQLGIACNWPPPTPTLRSPQTLLLHPLGHAVSHWKGPFVLESSSDHALHVHSGTKLCLSLQESSPTAGAFSLASLRLQALEWDPRLAWLSCHFQTSVPSLLLQPPIPSDSNPPAYCRYLSKPHPDHLSSFIEDFITWFTPLLHLSQFLVVSIFTPTIMLIPWLGRVFCWGFFLASLLTRISSSTLYQRPTLMELP